MKHIAAFFLLSALYLASFGHNVIGTYTADHRGIILPTPDGGQVCVQMVRPDIVRVRYIVSGTFNETNLTGVCVKHSEKMRFPVHVLHRNHYWQLISDSLCVEIPLDGGAIVFRDRRNNVLGREIRRSRG